MDTASHNSLFLSFSGIIIVHNPQYHTHYLVLARLRTKSAHVTHPGNSEGTNLLVRNGPFDTGFSSLYSSSTPTLVTMAAAIKALNAKIRSNKVLDYVFSTRMCLRAPNSFSVESARIQP